jgi:hypothetical protein
MGAITVSVYKTETAFSLTPFPKLVFCDQLEVLDYQYLSTVSVRSSDVRENVDLGQVVEQAGEFTVKTLKILDKSSLQNYWIKESKEQLALSCQQQPDDDPDNSGNGSTTVVIVSTKDALGLDQVDNTPDTDKPVSDPQKAYFRKKVPPIYITALGGESNFGPFAGLYEDRDILTVFNDEGKPLLPFTEVGVVPAGRFRITASNFIELGYAMIANETLTILR